MRQFKAAPGAFAVVATLLVCQLLTVSPAHAAAPTGANQVHTNVVRSNQTTSNLPFPSWWNGNCDANNFPGSYQLGSTSYRGLVACGPRNTQHTVHFYPGAWGVLEWQCVELSMRYLYLAYGIAPYQAYGSQVVWNYSGSLLKKIANNTAGQAPQAGDVLSYGSTIPGHTSVVISSSVDGNGNGSITVLEENASSTGTHTIPVSSWVVQPTYRMNITGWLHDPSTQPSSQHAVPQAVVNQGLINIYFRGADGVLHQTHWVNNGWVTDSPSTTPMAGNPSVVVNQGLITIYFRGADGLLHQTHWVNNGWVTDSPSSTPMGGDPTAVINQGLITIYFRGADGLLHQTHWVNNGWVTDSPSTTPMVGNASAVVNQYLITIYFQGTDGVLHQTHWVNNGWVTDSPSSIAMGGDPNAVVNQGLINIYFRGADGVLHQTHWVNNGWVTDSPSSTPMAGNPSVVVNQYLITIYFQGTDGVLHQTHWVNNGWVTDSPSSTPMGGDPNAVVNQYLITIYFRGTDGALYQTHWVSNGWVTDSPSAGPLA